MAEIWESVSQATHRALEQAGPVRIVAIGITNQRETVLFWDKKTGEPIHLALCGKIEEPLGGVNRSKTQGIAESVKEDWIGFDPYFSGTKAEWLLDHVDGARERAEKGELLFGTIDTWLIWKLCGAHVTDPSNASRTLLFNISTLDWDEDMLSFLMSQEPACPQW